MITEKNHNPALFSPNWVQFLVIHGPEIEHCMIRIAGHCVATTFDHLSQFLYFSLKSYLSATLEGVL